MSLLQNIKSIFSTSKQEEIVGKERKGVVNTLFYPYRKLNNGEVPNTNPNTILKLYQDDSDVKAAINAKLNTILASGWNLKGSKTPVANLTLLLNRSRYNRLHRQLLLNLLVFNNAFAEIEMKDDKPWKLHLLDVDTMEILHDKHGNVEGYLQRPKDTTQPIKFSPDEVWHISTVGITSKLWADIEMKALLRTVNTKNFVEKFINWLSATNQFRNVIKVKEATQEALDQFMADYIASQDDPNIPLVIDGEFEIEVMRSFTEAKSFIDIMSYFRHKIFMQLQVPPIVVGLVDNSNRSNSEMEYKIFQTNNDAIRRIYSEEFENELVPKLGMKDVQFVWNPIDKRSEKDDIEIAEKMVSMGLEDKAIEYFLRSTGFELPEGKLFKKKEEITNIVTNKRDSISEDMTQKKTGSEAETREDQLVGKTSGFNSYPYIIEKVD